MNLHDPILDRDAGTWVMFGKGLTYSDGIGHNPQTDPPAWMVQAAKPCETCDGAGVAAWEDAGPEGPLDEPEPITCPDCLDGRQRHTITVPCETCVPHRPNSTVIDDCPDCGLRSSITAPELAVVEWGPLVVRQERDWDHASEAVTENMGLWLWRYRFDGVLGVEGIELPPDINPASLVGQWAIGIKVVT